MFKYLPLLWSDIIKCYLQVCLKSVSSFSICSELKTLEWDILNPDYLIWVSNGHTFVLNHFFLDIVEKNQKPFF